MFTLVSHDLTIHNYIMVCLKGRSLLKITYKCSDVTFCVNKSSLYSDDDGYYFPKFKTIFILHKYFLNIKIITFTVQTFIPIKYL